MYRGFDLKDIPFYEKYYASGRELYKEFQNTFSKRLDNFISPDGVTSASALQENWFPQLNFDIFISHSHKNIDTAIALAGLLDEIDLTCFIDSFIWGYSENLLKEIDREHCIINGTRRYDYYKRNITTSHVHMMLSNALFKMIDSCECVFFLNSPESISVDSVVSKTVSPWIYGEISLTKIIRQRKINRDIKKGDTHVFSEGREAEIKFEYDIDLSHLTRLTKSDLGKWVMSCRDSLHVDTHALDHLYELFPTGNRTRRMLD